MNDEDKELLLQDLCARLPHHCRVFYEYVDDLDNKTYGYGVTLNTWCIDELDSNKAVVKPYLRPMSNMSEEEFIKLKEYTGLIYDQLDLALFQNGTYKCLDFYLNEIPSDVVILVFDWLNKNHFDYRGLIEKGFALEALEGMYK